MNEKGKGTILTENEEEEKKFEETNILPFNRTATGIKEPTDNWLIGLDLHTCFICRPKGPSAQGILDLVEYHVTYKTDKGAVRLLSNQNDEKIFWVDSARFSRQMELYEILGVATDDGGQQ